jgi:hypothetical protein
MACRGSGKVISNLGGSASEVQCPWCAGEGVRLVEIDAQAHWPAADQPQAAEPPADTSSADA